MSEALSQDPEGLAPGYGISTGSVVAYPSQPPTPSSTVQDAPNSNLPSFGTAFTGDIDAATGYPVSSERLLDISNWDYYEGLSGRLLERNENGLSIIASQPQYRPWESKPVDSTSQDSLRHSFATTTPVNTFSDAFAQNGVSKLPSFQSQFQTFNDPNGTAVATSETSLTTLTNLTPVSPNSSSNLTTLNTNFHTLSAVNARNYPLVPAPIQAREIPSIQQQFLDERHIQLYTHPTTNITTLNNTIHPSNIFQGQNGTALIQNNQLIQGPTVVTVLKSEPANLVDLKLGTNLTALQSEGLKMQNVGLHHTQFQNPMSTVLDNSAYNGLEKKINGFSTAMGSPTRSDFRKKERRKMRASSLESSATESDGASSNMEIGSENSGQVAAVSSTAGFKSPHQTLPTNGGMEVDEISGGNGDKQVKKKRKRCGECIGCQRKDNCGDCAPCRNDKSHQICKQRRCEKLTEKKNLYGDGTFGRGEARRGRGKGRGTGTYRGRKPAGGVSIAAASSTVAAPEPSPQPTSRPSPQPPITMLKPDQPAPVQQPMAPMPFYPDPNRFPAPVWQADPTQGWAQGQFIQQIPHAPQPTLEGYPQQYPNTIYQTTYQNPGFDTNTFYASPVQVLTNQRPPSTPGHAAHAPHAPLTPRSNGAYPHAPHTPSPSPQQQQQPQQPPQQPPSQQHPQQQPPQQQQQQPQSQPQQQNGHRTNMAVSGQYSTATEYQSAPGPAPGTLDGGSTAGGISRPSSVGSNQNQNFPPTSSSFAAISSSNFSPGTNAPPSYAGTTLASQQSSGNAKPGYPQVNSSPQLASHNSSGYPGSQFSGQNAIVSNDVSSQQQTQSSHQNWTPERDRNWEQTPNTGYVHQQIQSSHGNLQNMGHPQQQISVMHAQGPGHGHHQQQQSQELHPSSQIQHQHHQLQQHHNAVPSGGDQQFSQPDRVNLNSRIKTMILNKQQSLENKPEEAQRAEGNQTGHFLSYSHHRRTNYYSDGGGVFDFNPGQTTSALESFMKFASTENYTQKWSGPNERQKHFPYQDHSNLDKKCSQVTKVETYCGFNDDSFYSKPSHPTSQNSYANPNLDDMLRMEDVRKNQPDITFPFKSSDFNKSHTYQPYKAQLESKIMETYQHFNQTEPGKLKVPYSVQSTVKDIKLTDNYQDFNQVEPVTSKVPFLVKTTVIDVKLTDNYQNFNQATSKVPYCVKTDGNYQNFNQEESLTSKVPYSGNATVTDIKLMDNYQGFNRTEPGNPKVPYSVKTSVTDIKHMDNYQNFNQVETGNPKAPYSVKTTMADIKFMDNYQNFNQPESGKPNTVKTTMADVKLMDNYQNFNQAESGKSKAQYAVKTTMADVKFVDNYQHFNQPESGKPNSIKTTMADVKFVDNYQHFNQPESGKPNSIKTTMADVKLMDNYQNFNQAESGKSKAQYSVKTTMADVKFVDNYQHFNQPESGKSNSVKTTMADVKLMDNYQNFNQAESGKSKAPYPVKTTMSDVKFVDNYQNFNQPEPGKPNSVKTTMADVKLMDNYQNFNQAESGKAKVQYAVKTTMADVKFVDNYQNFNQPESGKPNSVKTTMADVKLMDNYQNFNQAESGKAKVQYAVKTTMADVKFVDNYQNFNQPESGKPNSVKTTMADVKLMDNYQNFNQRESGNPNSVKTTMADVKLMDNYQNFNQAESGKVKAQYAVKTTMADVKFVDNYQNFNQAESGKVKAQYAVKTTMADVKFVDNYQNFNQAESGKLKVPYSVKTAMTDIKLMDNYQNFNQAESGKSKAPYAVKTTMGDIKLMDNYQNFNHAKLEKSKILFPVKTVDIKLEKEAYVFEGDGGPAAIKTQGGSWCCRQGGTEAPTPEHLRDGACMGRQTQDEMLMDQPSDKKSPNQPEVKNEKANVSKEFNDNIEKLKNNVKTEVPACNCFPSDKTPPEPGSYYTHLGCASSLSELRKELENRIGINGKALRIEKICYTGKEGKTTQGCPMAKWIIRRSSYEEKILAIVKHRQGHSCRSAVIVVCMVAWDGVPSTEADQTYNLLTHKLNRYGLPTTRRCATNEPRTCACQGLDPDTCGASFSFGCSWSMYYNGCKYARSKTVRKFRLSVKSEENEIEERMHILATLLSPLYSVIAPDAFRNQCQFEREAPECRLGFKTGRPFSGVTACLDFCSHSHRDLHNMNNGCTVVVTLTKHRALTKPPDEQLHVLPLYVIDDSDEFGSKEAQEEKFQNGSIEVLTKYPCEVRVRSVPLQPCRRHGKKRKDDEPDAVIGKKEASTPTRGSSNSPRSSNQSSPRAQTPVSHQTPLIDMVSMLDNFTDTQLQSSQVSSTVLDSPTMYSSWNYESGLLNNQNQLVNQYGNQNQLYQPNQSWLDSQKRQNLYLNTWGEYPGHFYKDGIREDPDSTTAIPNSNLEEKNSNQVDSSTMTTGGGFEEKQRDFSRSYVGNADRYTPNSGITSSSVKAPQGYQNSSWGDINSPGSAPYQSQAQSPTVPISPDSKRASPISRNHADKASWSSSERSNWEQSSQGQSDGSPFRIPKGRPPSRSQSSTALSPDTNSSNSSTFLKPYPRPNKNRQTPEGADPKVGGADNNNRNVGVNAPQGKQAENLQPALNSWPEELKGDLGGYHPPVNPSNYLNQGYGGPNYAPFNSYSPYGAYEAGPLNYEYNYAEKLKREEYIRGSGCYNSYGYQNYPNWCQNSQNWVQGPTNWCLYPPFGLPLVPEQPKSEPIGEVTDFIDNVECFKDSQMGGVAIALGHGSVLFECAKHELHSTTALRKPNRLSPTRISLVFYQHRNLNKPKHGLDEWEEKMRLRKLGITTTGGASATTNTQSQRGEPSGPDEKAHEKEKEIDIAALVKMSAGKNSKQILMRAPTLTTMSWTTLFPMHPCMVTGPYQEGGAVG